MKALKEWLRMFAGCFLIMAGAAVWVVLIVAVGSAFAVLIHTIWQKLF